MVVRTTCGQCGQTLELPDLWAGKVIPCPECEVNVRLPLQKSKPDDGWPDQPPAGAKRLRQPPVKPAPEDVEFEELVECPMCGAEVSSRAEKCSRCGESLNAQQETVTAPPSEFKEEYRLYQARRNSLCVFWFFEAVVGGLLLVAAMNNLHGPPRLVEPLRLIIPMLMLGCVGHFFLSAASMGGSRRALFLAAGFSFVLLLASMATLLGMALLGARAPMWPTFVVIVPVKLMILALTIQVLTWHNRLRELKVLPTRAGSL